jgi:hypothetical protein
MHYSLVVYLRHGGDLYTDSTGVPTLTTAPAPSRAAVEQLADAQASGDRSPSGGRRSGALPSATGWCATRPVVEVSFARVRQAALVCFHHARRVPRRPRPL